MAGYSQLWSRFASLAAKERHMRMLVTVEFADAGTKSGSHRVLTIGRGMQDRQPGDIGLSLEEAKTLISSIQDEFVAAQAAEIVETARRCVCGRKLSIKDWKLRRIHTVFGRVYLSSPRVISCSCGGSQRRAMSPLKGWLARSSNELRYLAAPEGPRGKGPSRSRHFCPIGPQSNRLRML
jgi:hypothetical protein